MKDPTFDREGYPTEETLQDIRNWKITDRVSASELMNFCFTAWSDYGTKAYTDWEGYVSGYTTCELHTGGWSGNEDIMGALMDNYVFWNFCWKESKRGGHYKFDLSTLPIVKGE